MKRIRKYTLEIEMRSEISAMWPSSGYGRKKYNKVNFVLFCLQPKESLKATMSLLITVSISSIEEGGLGVERFKLFFFSIFFHSQNSISCI